MNPTIQRLANKIARSKGYGRATKIVFGGENKVISHTPYGYRKYTTGAYVPISYLSNFGWKNTYYQHAITEVMVNPGAGMLAFCAGMRK